ncbi:hypothetical protein SeMB42_g04167 [Synchytrium endobioticum]|nr:hypothetical protein SeMB42_g04167 [Synchytrium endobioticum]
MAKRSRAQSEEDQARTCNYPDHGLQGDSDFGSDDDTQPRKKARQDASRSKHALRGSIKHVELENFLIHKRMVVELGPNVNFISGANGAGKSSILTAIVVGLGARASQTNRSNGNIHSLIKYGESSATIRIALYNEGDDAYQPQQFGNEIIIERRIFQNNSTRYRLLNADKKCVSEKKVHLDAILDHFGIVPESPIMILNQDAAKSFLQKSTDQNKFLLFHEGTLLTKWQADLKISAGNLASIKNLARVKETELEPLKKVYERLDERLKKHQESRLDDQRAQGVQHEMFWALVARYENEINDLNIKLAHERRRLKRGQEEADKCELDAQTLEKEVNSLQGQVSEKAETRKDAEERQREKTVRRKELERNQNHNNANAREINQEIEAKRANIDDLEAKITAARNQMDVERRIVLDGLENRIRQEEEAEAQTREEQLGAHNEVHLKQQEMEALAQQCSGIQEELHRLKHEGKIVDGNIRNLQGRQRSKVAAWGNGMEQVVAEVEKHARQNRWTAGKPLGPLGQYVEVLPDAFNEYAKVIDLELGRNLSSFIVWSDQDWKLLKNISNQCRANLQIIKAKRGLDRSRIQVPASPYRTVERSVKVTNEDVYDTLLVNTQFERTVLVRDVEAGQALTHQYPQNCNKILTANNAVVGDKRFGGRGVNYGRWDHNSSARFVKDVQAEIQAAQERLRQIEHEISVKEGERRGIQARQTQMDDDSRTLRNKDGDFSRKLIEIRRRITQAKEERDAYAQLDDTDYQTEKEIEEESCQGLIAQLAPLMNRIKETKAEHDAIVASINADVHIIQTTKAEMERLRVQLEQLLLRNEDSKRTRQKVLEKCEQFQATIDECQASINYREQERREAEQVAQSMCERIELEKSYEELELELKEIDERRRQRNAQLGDVDLKKLVDDRNNAMTKYEAANQAVDQMKIFARLMHNSLQLRQDLLHKTTKQYRSQFKSTFSRLTRRRGYRGRIRIREENGGTMDVRVEKENDKESGKSKRTVNTLSGGEKSYSTLCFLMALWELMDSPFYALDEFDVFMDSVNRSQSIQLLTEASRPASGKIMQLILISPQGSFSIPSENRKFCKLIELTAPKRGPARDRGVRDDEGDDE